MPLPIDKTYLLEQLRNFKTIILDPDFKIQKTALPTASEDNEGAVFQYVGTDTTNYTIGGFYQCQEVTPATDPPTYTWVEVDIQKCDTLVVDNNLPASYLEFFDLIVAYAKEYGKKYSKKCINLHATWSGHVVCNVTGMSWGRGTFVLLQIIPQQANYNGIIIADNTSGSNKYYKTPTTQLT